MEAVKIMNKIIECVPNFSEGRDLKKVEKIVDCFRAKKDVRLLDYSSDEDHNRSVVTVIGEPEALGKAVIEAIATAIELIDMTKHKGQHPRMGAVDVVPFIPIKNTTITEADKLARKGKCMMSDLSQALDIALSTMTELSDRLVKKDLITKVRDAEDRRVVWVNFTEKGARIFQELLKSNY